MSKTVPVTVTLPADLIKEVDKIAKERKASRSKIVAEALRERTWGWRLAQLQNRIKPYAEKLGIRSEEDVERLLRS